MSIEREEDQKNEPLTARQLVKAFPKLGWSKCREIEKTVSEAEESDDPEDIDKAMERLNKLLDGHGVEAIQEDDTHVDKYWRNTTLLYVNMGDTYDTTILYSTEDGEFSIGSWGDFVEGAEEDDEDDESEGE